MVEWKARRVVVGGGGGVHRGVSFDIRCLKFTLSTTPRRGG